MELGSEEHRKLLKKSIFKTSQKIITMGVSVGVLLMLPNFLRDNTFSTGLLYAGIAIALGSTLYGLYLAYRKYKKIMLPFNEQYKDKYKP